MLLMFLILLMFLVVLMVEDSDFRAVGSGWVGSCRVGEEDERKGRVRECDRKHSVGFSKKG